MKTDFLLHQGEDKCLTIGCATETPLRDYFRERLTEVLFYHLLFRALGYADPYLDYSTEGWPLREYPDKRWQSG